MFSSWGSFSPGVRPSLIWGQYVMTLAPYSLYSRYVSMDLQSLSIVVICAYITYNMMPSALLPGVTSSRQTAIRFDAVIDEYRHLRAYCPDFTNIFSSLASLSTSVSI